MLSKSRVDMKRTHRRHWSQQELVVHREATPGHAEGAPRVSSGGEHLGGPAPGVGRGTGRADPAEVRAQGRPN